MSGLNCSTRELSLRSTGSSLRRAGSLVVARGFSCPVACGILVPQPGIEPVSTALEGRFLTTGPPGKALKEVLKMMNDESE